MHGPRSLTRQSGVTLTELLIAMPVLVIGLVALAATLIATSKSRDAATARLLVLNEARSLMEEISGSSPGTIFNAYAGSTRSINGVNGANDDGTVLTVNVDPTNPLLLVVSIEGRWFIGTEEETMTLQTRVLNANGT